MNTIAVCPVMNGASFDGLQRGGRLSYKDAFGPDKLGFRSAIVRTRKSKLVGVLLTSEGVPTCRET
jgi:hypothetical protein